LLEAERPKYQTLIALAPRRRGQVLGRGGAYARSSSGRATGRGM